MKRRRVKSAQRPSATASVLPMDIQIGDRLAWRDDAALSAPLGPRAALDALHHLDRLGRHHGAARAASTAPRAGDAPADRQGRLVELDRRLPTALCQQSFRMEFPDVGATSEHAGISVTFRLALRLLRPRPRLFRAARGPACRSKGRLRENHCRGPGPTTRMCCLVHRRELRAGRAQVPSFASGACRCRARSGEPQEGAGPQKPTGHSANRGASVARGAWR